jgi:uncharacterized damage-inducible protein DinB
MPRSTPAAAPDLLQGILEAYAINERMNQLVLEHLDRRLWRAHLLDQKKARTIGAIFTHVHNVRCKWLRLSAPHLKPPPQLHRSRCTQPQAIRALAESGALCSQMLVEALAPKSAGKQPRVTQFQRDGWARPWPPGAAMVAYMITHEAHHRGQACMLAHQLGFPLSHKITSQMWGWEKLWKDCGFKGPK